MSIPPLVCSTPPPPDQCDDKDHDDFDLQYNLAHDDDDENYDYGSFSTFNYYQSSSKIGLEKNLKSSKVIENDENCEISSIEKGANSISPETDAGTKNNCNTTSKQDEEIIEDLDLHIHREFLEKANITELINSDIEINETNIDKESVEKTHIQEVSNTVIGSDLDANVLSTEECNNEAATLEPVVGPMPCTVKINTDEPNDFIVGVSELNTDSVTELFRDLTTIENKSVEPTVNVKDDDFGNFDDFQFASTETTPASVIVESNNPWDSKNVAGTNDDDFGDFTANFDGQDNNEHSKEIATNKQNEDNVCDDNDFGDFDDFKSSTVLTSAIETAHASPCQHTMFKLQPDNEDQFLESIEKVLNSIFEYVIPEEVEDLHGKLESMMGETWGHLLETEIRQPYMVNWNNSLGQKTLLRALCIDSRNILFGPKWSDNMPKYAVNLSTAPLQPQKQTSASNSSMPDNGTIKSSDKPASTWTDPFTSDGQESCSPARQSDVLETGPTDLDVFEASTSSKPDKIYSSTLSVQPLRQINLPDTHIFTPSDSETPRSKTIHYENSSTILLPQTSIEQDVVSAKVIDSDEYWEFPDFKGTSIPPEGITGQPIAESSRSALKTNVTYGVQVLQPMKVEPIMPTLNWPDPGEVKETFDDFSDFVSSTCNNDAAGTTAEISVLKPAFTAPSSSQFVTNDGAIPSSSNSLDDEFDTFQSAAPPKISSLLFNMESITKDTATNKTLSSMAAPEMVADFGIAFPKADSLKSDISLPNTRRNVKDHLAPNSLTTNHIKEEPKLHVKHVPLQPQSMPLSSNSLLQPTTVNSINSKHNQQNSGQILQPLSLESYSQINWPNPGIDLQDLSRFNPVETLNSLKTDLSTNALSKNSSPVHSRKPPGNNQLDDDWGDFVSSIPKHTQPQPKNIPTFVDDDEWTDFVSSSSVKPQNGLNTISLNVHTNLNNQKTSKHSKYQTKNQMPLDIPSLNYITPKSNSHKTYNDRHFQNL